MIDVIVVITLTLSISAYTPGANAISGGSVMANGQRPHWGAFACPSVIPLGSGVRLLGEAKKRADEMGLPTEGVCTDRFARRYSSGHLDVCIPQRHWGMSNDERLKWAFAWGRRSGVVEFRLPPSAAIVRRSKDESDRHRNDGTHD